ncbi:MULTISPECIES: ABC transporter substrate-binding protein [unclassified Bradyrhizobium]|uniref:ABC transporter substrate-binding protein n=1 Tax=unclassified Bradyrhizobium TaxID=2631580 RepID=UPI00047F409C|nr:MULTISPECIES: ABC transporter substrate-binding protein [unclassified Bradyrhizobium]MCP3464055.1 ABC transporter substrate-binding protein [Bradyrhizobium sp. CCGUVB23]
MRTRQHASPLDRLLVGLCASAVCFLLCAAAFAENADSDGKAGAGDTRTRLVVKATTDIAEATELVAEFMKLNPEVRVQYSKISSTELYDEIAKPFGQAAAVDVAWSSAMDLQIKLANDGYASEYRSTELEGIPDWARWKDRAYGITAEPVVIVFNKRLLRGSLVPKDRAELLRVLTNHPAVFHGKIATYDPELSGTGLLFLSQDVRVTADTWKLVAAMGQSGVKLYTSSAAMIDRVSTGDLVLAYNVLGSYALERAKHEPDLGVIFPGDYTLLLSRIALIPRSAEQPELARRFVDFLLSRTGQTLLARHSLGSVRDDMKPAIPGFVGAEKALRPIALSIDLLTYLDQAKRRRFLRDWKDALREH